MEIHVHIHNSDQDKKFDKILEAIEKWHEKEIKEINKKIDSAIKDLNSTQTK